MIYYGRECQIYGNQDADVYIFCFFHDCTSIVKSLKKNYCLIAALASLVAFSTMAASVMSGCGENSDEQKTTKIVHETRIDTQIETKIETYTEVVTDSQGNTEYVELRRQFFRQKFKQSTEFRY